jgi:hypothetical protein
MLAYRRQPIDGASQLQAQGMSRTLERVLSEPWGRDSATAAFRRKLTSKGFERKNGLLDLQ